MYSAEGRDNKEMLIQEYLPIIQQEANALQARLSADIHLNDLIQAGLQGLYQALEHFDAFDLAANNTFRKRIRIAMATEVVNRWAGDSPSAVTDRCTPG